MILGFSIPADFNKLLPLNVRVFIFVLIFLCTTYGLLQIQCTLCLSIICCLNWSSRADQANWIQGLSSRATRLPSSPNLLQVWAIILCIFILIKTGLFLDGLCLMSAEWLLGMHSTKLTEIQMLLLLIIQNHITMNFYHKVGNLFGTLN